MSFIPWKSSIKINLLDHAISTAREQIVSRGYSKPYITKQKRIIEIGVAVTGRTDVSVVVFSDRRPEAV